MDFKAGRHFASQKIPQSELETTGMLVPLGKDIPDGPHQVDPGKISGV